MFSVLVERHNNALDINRPNANRNLTEHGSDWLWAVTAVMGLTFLAWLAWTISRNKAQPVQYSHSKNNNISDVNHGVNRPVDAPISGERIFHYLFTTAAFIAFISYFTMAADLGNTPIRQYLHHGRNPLQTRQIFYVRYIYYVTAWPLVLIALLLLSGVSWATILFCVAILEIWVVSWLCGALVSTSYKWGYFGFGVFAYLVLAYLLMTWGTQHATRIRTKKDYTLLAGLLVLAWAAFPIAWGLSEGANRLSITGEMIFYGILDLIAIPVYGTLFLFLSHKRFGPALFPFTQHGRVPYVEQTTTMPHTGVPAGQGVV